ncbi:MAG: hypothetical protein ACXU9O_10715 [Gemmatimonadaceae bacterium]
MKPTTLVIAAVGAIMLLPGCALRAPKTEVTADDFDLTPLVGQWSGEYNSKSTGRVGDISFVLRAGEVSADGRIEMVAREPENVIVPTDRPMVNGRVTTPARRLLTIHFVRKEGRRVIGLLDPYIDPDCACRVTTTFEGVFTDGHTIEGTYSTSSSELAHIPSGGQWKVTRAKRL